MLELLDDRRVIAGLLKEIKSEVKGLEGIRIMEVCGTHSVVAARSGLSNILRKMGIFLISGPGCPVCITPDEIIAESMFLILSYPNIILASFGDMLRVPTKRGSLESANWKEGSSVKIIYSPEEVIGLSLKNQDKQIVFLAPGFETTIPLIGWVLKKAQEKRIKNLSIIPVLRLVPPALKALLIGEKVRIDGFLYPGHVSVIIGSDVYSFIPQDFGIPGAITGFEPADLLLGILSVLRQIKEKKPIVDIAYKRVVRKEGNKKAYSLILEIFDVYDAKWRGFGEIPESGLIPKEKFREFRLTERFCLKPDEIFGINGCRCGDVIKGLVEPIDCPLFDKVCNPSSPMGPCMVSYEGTCLIYHKYKDVEWMEEAISL